MVNYDGATIIGEVYGVALFSVRGTPYSYSPDGNNHLYKVIFTKTQVLAIECDYLKASVKRYYQDNKTYQNLHDQYLAGTSNTKLDEIKADYRIDQTMYKDYWNVLKTVIKDDLFRIKSLNENPDILKKAQIKLDYAQINKVSLVSSSDGYVDSYYLVMNGGFFHSLGVYIPPTTFSDVINLIKSTSLAAKLVQSA